MNYHSLFVYCVISGAMAAASGAEQAVQSTEDGGGGEKGDV